MSVFLTAPVLLSSSVVSLLGTYLYSYMTSDSEISNITGTPTLTPHSFAKLPPGKVINFDIEKSINYDIIGKESFN